VPASRGTTRRGEQRKTKPGHTKKESRVTKKRIKSGHGESEGKPSNECTSQTVIRSWAKKIKKGGGTKER